MFPMSVLSVVQQMHVEGQRRWPSIVVQLNELQHHCEPWCVDSSRVEKARLFATEIYLCCACANGDPAALAVLWREAEGVARTAIARIQCQPEFVQDTLQEFWKKLLLGPDPRIRAYSGAGPLHAWLQLCATRLAIDRQRSSRALVERELDLDDCLMDDVLGPESSLTRVRYFKPFRAALRRAISKLSRKDRNLLRMHAVERCSIDQIGRAYDVHRATAARWLDRARKQVFESVRSELDMTGPHLTDSEFRSVARALGGELTLDPAMFLTRSSLEGPATSR